MAPWILSWTKGFISGVHILPGGVSPSILEVGFHDDNNLTYNVISPSSQLLVERLPGNILRK